LDAQALQQLAVTILAHDGEDPDQLVDLLGRYAEAFEEWYAAFQRGAATLSPDLGKELARLHGQVLSRAKELQRQTATDMRKLREKGKGVLRYIDTLPQRVSFTPTKRG